MIKYKEFPSNYKVRSTGWIQDAANFNNLNAFVSLFYPKSNMFLEIDEKIKKILIECDAKKSYLEKTENGNFSFAYNDIVGKSPNSSRKTSTVCNGIGQAALKGQKREFQGDWPTDNFLRWAETLQFLERDVTLDEYAITNKGIDYVTCHSEEEKNIILKNQLLHYSPAIQILKTLNDSDSSISKFDIGESLGFVGEKGFTSISCSLFVEKYFASNERERKKMKSDFEGSSDKYARQICSWLLKLKLVDKEIISYNSHEDRLELDGYKISTDGKEFLRKAKQNYVYIPFGMLSMSSKNKEFHCKQRALILKSLETSPKTLKQIFNELKSDESFISDLESLNYYLSEFEIKSDIKSLKNIGIDIVANEDVYQLKNRIIGLDIPRAIELGTLNEVEKIKNKLKNELEYINYDLLNIVDYSYSKKSSRIFEIYVAKVLEVIYEKVLLMGGPSKPDVVASDSKVTYIVDAKAYKDGFTLPIGEQDKMVRYIKEYLDKKGIWIDELIEKDMYKSKEFTKFMFVSSSFKNLNNKLNLIESRTDGISGEALSAVDLLILANTRLSINS
ncbi:MAG: restriction endonuclease FokI recognition domain-containing protein [Erysipelotrichaceae bacterium]